MSDTELHKFADGAALAEALADKVATSLADAIARDGVASLAVSGGSTPARFFQALSMKDLPWDKVTVTLVDERFVGPDDERSNHGLVDRLLLQNAAQTATFVALFEDRGSAEEAAIAAAARVSAIKRPLDVAVMGMGTDGHTASWFPGSAELAAATSPEATDMVIAAHAPGAPEPRLTMTMPMIAEAALCVLHIEGAAKQDVLAEAKSSDDVADMPIRALLSKSGSPLQIYWAP